MLLGDAGTSSIAAGRNWLVWLVRAIFTSIEATFNFVNRFADTSEIDFQMCGDFSLRIIRREHPDCRALAIISATLDEVFEHAGTAIIGNVCRQAVNEFGRNRDTV